MVNLSELRGGLLVLAGLVVVLLLLIAFTPGLPGEMLLQTLRFHILAGGVVLLVVMLLAGLRWRALAFFLLLGAGAVQGGALMVEMHTRRDVPVGGTPVASLDVLSYNVLTGNLRAEDAAQFIIDAAPDIAVIMETPGIRPYLDAIAEVLPYRVGCTADIVCDLSILSRHPIIEGQVHRMWPFRFERLVTARIEKDGVPVTIAGVHLSKPYFDQASWGETQQLISILARQEGDLILAGDFNAAPWSDTLVHLAREARLVPAPSHPATWPVSAGALGVPIDNMFTRGAARIVEMAAGEETYGSNHRYLRATVGIYEAL